MNLTSDLKHRLRIARRLLADLRLPVADLRHDGLRVRIIGERANLAHLSKVLFDELLPSRSLSPSAPWELAAALATGETEADLLFLAVSDRLVGQRLHDELIELPNLVAQAIDLPRDSRDLLPYLKNSRTCSDLNKIRQLGFTYEISHDPIRLREFYTEHYVPYIRQRHGDYAYVCTFDELRREFDAHELLVVFSGARMIAGSLMRLAGGHYHLVHIGVRGDDQALLQQGAVSAIYYFACLEGIRRGARQVILGRVIPFLNDGIMFFKKKWHSHIVPDLTPDRRLFLKICNAAPQTRAALSRMPLIFRRAGQLRGLQWLAPEHLASEKQFRAHLHRVCYAGLERLLLIVEPGLDLPSDWLDHRAPQLDCPVELLRLSQFRPNGLRELVHHLNEAGPDAKACVPLDFLTHPSAT